MLRVSVDGLLLVDKVCVLECLQCWKERWFEICTCQFASVFCEDEMLRKQMLAGR